MSSKGITIFDPPIINITLLEGTRFNLPMFRKDIKIFRGVNNTLKFEVKDSDRRPVKLLSQELKIIIINAENQELMFERVAEIEDEEKGIYKIKLYPGDIHNWLSGFYDFTIILKDFEEDEQVLYVDNAQNPVGHIELIDRPIPAFIPSEDIVEDRIRLENMYKVTDIFPGDAQKNFQDILHSVAVYSEDFTGKFIIQGSLEDMARFSTDFFDIVPDGETSAEIDFANSTSLRYFNFDGNFMWVRFKVVEDITNTGKIPRILYKN